MNQDTIRVGIVAVVIIAALAIRGCTDVNISKHSYAEACVKSGGTYGQFGYCTQ